MHVIKLVFLTFSASSVNLPTNFRILTVILTSYIKSLFFPSAYSSEDPRKKIGQKCTCHGQLFESVLGSYSLRRRLSVGISGSKSQHENFGSQFLTPSKTAYSQHALNEFMN